MEFDIVNGKNYCMKSLMESAEIL